MVTEMIASLKAKWRQRKIRKMMALKLQQRLEIIALDEKLVLESIDQE